MKKIILLVAFLCLSATGLALAAGQGDDPGLNQGQERTLNGHTFMPSLYVADPWVASTFMNHTGGGMTSGLETPFYNLDGEEIFVLDGSMFFASLGLGYQHLLGSSWTVGIKAAANMRSGINSQTLVTEGANVDRSLHVWVKHRILRTEKDQLTLGLDWDYAKTFIITPQEFAHALVNGEDLDSASLLHDLKGWTARFTAEYAHAFSPTYGLRANGAVGLYEVPLVEGIAKATHRVGLTLEMDLKHKYGLPLGFSLGQTLGFPKQQVNAGASGTLLGFWYTGQEHIALGLETGLMTVPASDSDNETDAMFGVLSLRYYF